MGGGEEGGWVGGWVGERTLWCAFDLVAFECMSEVVEEGRVGGWVPVVCRF